MEIYIITKLVDDGDGAVNHIIAVEKTLNDAKNKLNEDVEELLKHYGLDKEYVDYYDDNSVVVSNTDAEMKNYIYASYGIKTWNI